ncbi:hypothetical protein N9L27_02535 [Candidatus Poseidoniales archaeon]|nr:hypothetical protein [Candidatus Poseidoniales archaeon]
MPMPTHARYYIHLKIQQDVGMILRCIRWTKASIGGRFTVFLLTCLE